MGEVALAAVEKLEIEGVVFPELVRPPASSNTLFLAGAGERGIDIGGNFIKFTAIGLYLDPSAAPSLAGKWGGKAADELLESADFFRDIITGPFEKFVRVTMIKPLSGEQYSEKVMENCVASCTAAGIYTEAEAEAVRRFKEAFKPQIFPPGSSALFTHSPSGVLTLAFSKDEAMPQAGDTVIDNRALCEAVLESIIGPNGVSPAVKRSLAVRLPALLKEQCGGAGAGETAAEEPVAEHDLEAVTVDVPPTN